MGDEDKSRRRSSVGLLEGEVDTLNKQVQHSETIDMQVNSHCAEEWSPEGCILLNVVLQGQSYYYCGSSIVHVKPQLDF